MFTCGRMQQKFLAIDFQFKHFKEMRGKMRSPKDEFVDIAKKITGSASRGPRTKEESLVYLIERALFLAEKVAAEASKLRMEQWGAAW